jgi:hypothetical protein
VALEKSITQLFGHIVYQSKRCLPRLFSTVLGAFHSKTTLVENVGVNHGGFYVLVTENFLNRPDIVAFLQKVGRKGMSKGMASNAFGDPRAASGQPDRFLNA